MRITPLAFAALALGGCTPAVWQPIPLPAPTVATWTAPPGKVRLIGDTATLTGDGITLIRDTFWVARIGEPYTPLPRQEARGAQGLRESNRTVLIAVGLVVGIAVVVGMMEGISSLEFPCTPPNSC